MNYVKQRGEKMPPKEKQTLYSIFIHKQVHNVTGRKRSPAGYVLLCIKEHPNSDVLGYIFEHRIVMEMKLGRYLKANEVIHHKNENKHDNRLENLELMKRGEHTSMHHIGSSRNNETKNKMSKMARKRHNTPNITKEQLENEIKSDKTLREVFKHLNIHQGTYYKFVDELGLQEIHKQYRGRR